MEKLKYFVYTSGEENFRQVDWSAKFVSDDFTLPNGVEIDDSNTHESLIDLSNAYTENVGRFGLSGGLAGHRPSGDGLGYIVLPWNEKYTLVGIYANFADLKKRANIGLVMASVPRDIRKSMSPREVINGLLKENNIREIAAPRLNKEDAKDSPRPKRLLLDDSGTTEDMDPSLKVLEGVGWPARKNAFILTDGKIQKFKSEEPKAESESSATGKKKGKDSPRKKKSKKGLVIGVILVIVLIAAAMTFMGGGQGSKETGTSGPTVTREQEEAARKLEELVASVINKGDDGRLYVVGVAMVDRVGEDSYEIDRSLAGKLPAGKFEVFYEGSDSVVKPVSGDFIVNPNEVRKKLASVLSQLKYVEDLSDTEPVYRMTQEEWDQTIDDIKKLCWEYSPKSESESGRLAEDVYKDRLKEELQKGGEPQIAFFGLPDGISQNVRIVSIDEDKNVEVSSYVMKVGEDKILSPEAQRKWNARFITGEKRNPPVPAMQFKKPILLLYGRDLEGAEAYKNFIDQMIEALVN